MSTRGMSLEFGVKNLDSASLVVKNFELLASLESPLLADKRA